MPETPTLLCVLCGRDEDHHTALKQCYVRYRGLLVPSPNERFTPDGTAANSEITRLRSALASSRADTERLDRLPALMWKLAKKYTWPEATPILTRAAIDLAWSDLSEDEQIAAEEAMRAAVPSSDERTSP